MIVIICIRTDSVFMRITWVNVSKFNVNIMYPS